MAKKKKSNAGRKQIDIDWDAIDKYLVAGANGPQVASVAGMHPHTFYRRCLEDKGQDFTNYSAEKRQKGNSMLHAKQFQAAMGGNTTMLVWLGKQRLSQTDQPRDTQEFNGSLSNLLGVMHLVKTSEDFDVLVQLANKNTIEKKVVKDE